MSTTSVLRKLAGSATSELLPLSGHARGAIAGFRPMAVLHDPEQAFKPENVANTPQAAPVSPSTAPGTANTHLALSGMPACKNAARRPRWSLPAFSGNTQTGETVSAFSRPAGVAGSRVLSGRLSDVCNELERLVAQEERYLHAG